MNKHFLNMIVCIFQTLFIEDTLQIILDARMKHETKVSSDIKTFELFNTSQYVLVLQLYKFLILKCFWEPCTLKIC